MPILRAAAIILVLVAMALMLARAGQAPVPVNLSIGSLTLTTTAPVAITLAILSLLLAFYAGQLGSWLARVPSMVSNLIHRRQRQSAEDSLAQAYAAWLAGDLATARKLTHNLHLPGGPLARLATLLHMGLGQLTPTQAEDALADPTLTLPIGLHLARQAATAADWPALKILTTRLRQTTTANPAINTLHFKALVNTDDPAATAFVPQLKPLLGSSRTKLLSGILQGPTTLTARPLLDNPWVKAFQLWLPTPSEVFPDEKTAS